MTQYRGTIPADQWVGRETHQQRVARLAQRKVVMPAGITPVVALDIDGVMADFNAAMKPYSNVANTDETCPKYYDFVQSGWFDTWLDFEKAHCEVMDSAHKIPLLDSTAPQAVADLKNSGMKVIVVTARREQWRKETEKFFAVNDIDIRGEDIFFMDNKKKTDMNYHYIIDDSPKNIADTMEYSSANVVAYNQRYNADLAVSRVDSLRDFADYVVAQHQ